MLSKVVRLEELDEGALEGFTCGDDWMDGWLANKASRQLKSGLCVMHVSLDDKELPVGFFTLATCQVMPADVLKRERHGYNHIPFGARLIGELAVRADLRGGGLGIRDPAAQPRHSSCSDISRDAGVAFVVVDPQGGNEHLCRWYRHHGFVASPEGVRHYMPIRIARERMAALGDDYFVFE